MMLNDPLMLSDEVPTLPTLLRIATDCLHMADSFMPLDENASLEDCKELVHGSGFKRHPIFEGT
jgi:hypothetical protein